MLEDCEKKAELGGTRRKGCFGIFQCDCCFLCKGIGCLRPRLKSEGCWRDASIVEHTTVLAKDPGSIPSTHDRSQPYVIPGPGDPVPSYGLLRHQECMECTDIHAGKTSTYIKSKIKTNALA